ncbi:hypothetical protein BDZ45DRAFT_679071 [Acephala macrosclerotiorum]|nr:hypothetical protein BDZ45DRAFT_679071 [Acephala macrosclerotiorum]
MMTAVVEGGDEGVEVVRSLLERGADTSIKDVYGKLAVEYAEDEKVKELLMERRER